MVVVISEATISAPHAMLDLAEAGLEVKDMNSSNGLVINGVRLQPGWQSVEPGLHVLMGKAEFAFDGKTFNVISGDVAGSYYGPFDEPVVISRESMNVVRLGTADGNISDAHVLFLLVENNVQIRDLSSRSGTRVNGMEATRNQILQPGDRIQLGLSEFIFQPE
jgi:pSer/pThr/pTyr-binding forkhead associated (FHA) protein